MLVRKELRQSLPWLLLGAVSLMAIAGCILWLQVRYSIYDSYDSYRSTSRYFDITRHPPLQAIGPVLLITSLALGLILGIQHFWMPHFKQTWSFLLHRSVSRKTIFMAKLTAAALGFVMSLGIVWLALYFYGYHSANVPAPPVLRVFVEGCIFMMLGLVVYLATAVTGLSTARWYTTKIFPLLFTPVVIVATVCQWKLAGAFAVIIVGVVILLSQALEIISNREF